MLLYLVKHSHLDLANVTRNVSKANNGANSVDYKELLHVIKYALDMKNFGLKIEPIGNSHKPWEITCFCDSNYVGDLVSRGSITGFILHELGVQVS